MKIVVNNISERDKQIARGAALLVEKWKNKKPLLEQRLINKSKKLNHGKVNN